MEEVCELGSPLRPHVVWFGEAVPMIEEAARICSMADIFILVGTSLAVYPAAGLIHYIPDFATKFLIDPRIPAHNLTGSIKNIEKNAASGVAEVVSALMAK